MRLQYQELIDSTIKISKLPEAFMDDTYTAFNFKPGHAKKKQHLNFTLRYRRRYRRKHPIRTDLKKIRDGGDGS